VAERKKSRSAQFQEPVPISEAHDCGKFDSGQAALNDWLRRRALRNEQSGGSRTYVVCRGSSNEVVAYYSLSAGAVAHAGAPGRVRRNMPDPVPVMVIGRLAVDRAVQGQGVGRGILRDAILRTIQAAAIVGIRAILVHAISGDAARFYERCGFRASPIDPMTLMITVAEAEKSLAE
jgi:GNAT superfamily N-acetyltransferase